MTPAPDALGILEALQHLRLRAETAIIPVAVLRAAAARPEAGGYAPEGQTLDFGLLRVTFTVEEQPRGLCRHVSISIEGESRPNINDVDAIKDALGFTQSIEALAVQGLVYMEHGDRHAVNLIEPVTYGED